MKTVSTKLDNSLHNRFIEICNEDGKCQSEFLRDLIEQIIEVNDIDEETTQELEAKVEDIKQSQGKIKKISHDDGKTWFDVLELQNITVE